MIFLEVELLALSHLQIATDSSEVRHQEAGLCSQNGYIQHRFASSNVVSLGSQSMLKLFINIVLFRCISQFDGLSRFSCSNESMFLEILPIELLHVPDVVGFQREFLSNALENILID